MADISSCPETPVKAVGATPYSAILKEHDVATSQREHRKDLLVELAKPIYSDNDGPNGVVAHISHWMLESADIPILADILLKFGDVKTLTLILHSPGGDGTVVEKFIGLCRCQCKRFRVIVPHEAMSAATMIVLGADELIMGPPSGLGPIDAQVEVGVSGVKRWVSAQSFIDARDKLLEQYNEQMKKKEDTGATLQMLATLDFPFIAHCEDLMAFGRDVAEQSLVSYMFKDDPNKGANALKVVQELSSVKKHKVHSRVINGQAARQLLGSKVKLCGEKDKLWTLVWEYYMRAETLLGQLPITKLFETEYDFFAASRV